MPRIPTVVSVIAIVGIILLIVGTTYKNSNPKKQEDARRAFYIAGGIVLGSGIAMAIVYFLYSSPKQVSKRIASSMLAEKNPEQYLESCDSLIEASFQDPSIISQFKQLKESAKPEEVTNFCGNMAKNVLGKV